MNKVKRVKNENFTIISNVFLKDKRLSIKAKGFLAVVMGLPSDWEFTINGVCSIIKEGKTAIYNVIDELKEYGYCSVATCRDEKGRISGKDYTFFEEPQIDLPQVESPRMENPNMDNQPQLNTYNTKDLFDKGEKEDKSSKKNEQGLAIFEQCWIGYRRKGSKAKAKKEWMKLSEEDINTIQRHIPFYVESVSDIKYQKDFERYLKDKIFLNVVYKNNVTLFDPDDNNTTTDNDTLIINGVCYK